MCSKWLFYWRIALTLAGLDKGSFFARGLPPPTVAPYATFTAKTAQSKGGLVRQGYKNVTLQWAELDGLQLETLTDVVEAGITAGSLYLTVDKANGTGVQDAFIDVHGVPQPVDYTAIPNGRGMIFQNVSLTVTAIVVDNDPSNVL